MKKLHYLILFLVTNVLFSQNYHYTSYSDYFDYISYDNIKDNKISKIEIDIEDYQTITAYFNDKAQIKKIETKDKSLNKIISKTIFTWNSNFNYLLSSLSDYQSEDFSFMTKTHYNYIQNGDAEMKPTSVTQYWLYKGFFWYAENYNLYNYSNTITRSLDGAVDYTYFQNNLLKTIKIRKVTSDEFSSERSIIYPKHHIQENKTVEFEYNNLYNLKKVKNYFRKSITSVKDLIYHDGLLTNIVEKTNYNNSRTELTYSNKLVSKISLTSDLYPNSFISKINYYDGDKIINSKNYFNPEKIKHSYIEKSKNETSTDKLKSIYTYYKTIVNLNLRSSPSINSKVITMIPRDNIIMGVNAKNTKKQDTFEINGKSVISKWINTEYNSFKGWAFKGGLSELKGHNINIDSNFHNKRVKKIKSNSYYIDFIAGKPTKGKSVDLLDPLIDYDIYPENIEYYEKNEAIKRMYKISVTCLNNPAKYGIKYEYDNQNRIIKETGNYDEGDLYNLIFEYYENGELKNKITRFTKSWEFRDYLEYIKEGDIYLISKITSFSPDKSISRVVHFKYYNFDESRNWTKREMYLNNVPKYITKRSIEYYN